MISYVHEQSRPSLADLLLRRARMIYAGHAAETFLETQVHYFSISLIEELIASRGIITDPARWDEDVHHDVFDRLHRNQQTFRRIATILFEKSRLGGALLQKILADVPVNP